ncbi:hypothetical protein [Pelagibius sp.]|uniref:hypothetical protein n=1 Tax=Pelagibius sp. TaxID=1931238 RepID=UPI003B50C749
MDWEIDFRNGCGALRFGMSTAEVSRVIGPPDESRLRHEVECFGDDEWRDCTYLHETRSEHGWRECVFLNDSLKELHASPMRLPCLTLGGTDVLTLPILSFIEELDKANSGIGQAQGGSLYFDDIGIAILQFEVPSIREFVMFAADYDHEEPLAPVSLAEVKAYYTQTGGHLPDNDLLKPVAPS